MSRLARTERIVTAAETWQERCLEVPGSLFEERPLWSRENFEELRELYVENPDEGDAGFFEKLENQLNPGSPEAKCLMAEMTWVVYLIDSNTRADTKLDRIATVWKWSGRDFPHNHELLRPEVLGAGAVHVAHHQIWRDYQSLVVAMLEWTMLTNNARERLLGRPWDFASWLDGTDFAEGTTLRHALLYLLFPDEFEPIISKDAKWRIANSLRHGDERVGHGVDLDQFLLRMRGRLEERSPGEEVHFFHKPYVEFWNAEKANSWFLDNLGEITPWYMNVGFDDGGSWPGVVEDGVVSIGFDKLPDLGKFTFDGLIEHLSASGFGRNPNMHRLALWHFAKVMKPGDLIMAWHKSQGLVGWAWVKGEYEYERDAGPFRVHTRRVEWHRCDPVRVTGGYLAVKRLTQWSSPDASVRRLLWFMGYDSPPPQPYTPEDACEDLFIPRRDFERFLHLMESRRNLILQGPPGTGKTFMARRIAWCLIGRKDSAPIEMVQFHQSYAYEDFVQGYRPTDSGGFELRDGVFHRFCERARRDPKTPYIFIIDEINRGNLSRIFGELLMLIEADKRSDEYAVSLTYADPSGGRFHIPDNVYILGMMNTADRSLALVDYALRRRFAFATLSPAYGTEHGKKSFRAYLEGQGVAGDLVTRIIERMTALNEEIANDPELGHGFRVGHSYFVPTGNEVGLDGTWYETVVETQIEPLLREYWFDSHEKVDSAVDRLKTSARLNDGQ